MAAAWIVNEAIFQAVNRIAPGNHRARDHRKLRGRQNIDAILMRHEPGPQKSDIEMDAVIAGITRNNAVVIRGESLRFRERLLSAGGAAAEVRLPRKFSVIVPSG